MSTTPTPIHVGIVLDRSGSMNQIAPDIVGGFNQYLQEQQESGTRARITMVQFDGHDPFEILYDGVALAEIAPLSSQSYQPRGATPLYDAVGRMLAHLGDDRDRRKELRLPEEDIVVMIITDGHENASRHFKRQDIFDAITARREEDWVFVFLGADQDSYVEGERIGVSAANRRDWDKSAQGTREMWDGASRSQELYYRKTRAERASSKDEYWPEKQRLIEQARPRVEEPKE